MNRSLQRTTASEAGFTLIEMLVVLTILALATAFAGPLLSGGSKSTRLQMASDELASAFRLTRSAEPTPISSRSNMPGKRWRTSGCCSIPPSRWWARKSVPPGPTARPVGSPPRRPCCATAKATSSAPLASRTTSARRKGLKRPCGKTNSGRGKLQPSRPACGRGAPRRSGHERDRT